MTDKAICGLCGEPMPQGEEMFQYHGYSGPCPKPPLNDQGPNEAADEYADFSKELDEVRRKMRAKVLALDDQELHQLYYRSITLSEHEASRRVLLKTGAITAMVHVAGGLVEGRPTGSHNILQRIRELLIYEKFAEVHPGSFETWKLGSGAKWFSDCDSSL